MLRAPRWLFAHALLLSVGAVDVAQGQAAEAIPKAHPASRYQSIWENSPFQLEAPPPANAAPKASFSQHLALVGITRVKEKTVVTIRNKKDGTVFDVHEDKPSNSIRLVEVSVNRDPSLTEVKLAKGAEIGTVGYERQLLASASSGSPQRAKRNSSNAQSVLNRSSQNPQPAVARRRVADSANSASNAGTDGSSKANSKDGSAEASGNASRKPPTQVQRRRIILPQSRNE